MSININTLCSRTAGNYRFGDHIIDNYCITFQPNVGVFMLIYKITNQINGKCYVGQVSSLNTLKNFDNYWGSGKIIKRAIKKHGLENFTKEILEDNIQNREELCKKEKYWINFYNTIHPNGYNITP